MQSNIGAELSILLPRAAAKHFPAMLSALDEALDRLGVRSCESVRVIRIFLVLVHRVPRLVQSPVRARMACQKLLSRRRSVTFCHCGPSEYARRFSRFSRSLVLS